MNTPEELKDQSAGWWYPNSLIQLLESKEINENEFTLLGKINALSQTEEGCWASNTTLGKWWSNRTPKWVQITLSKLHKKKLLRIVYKTRNGITKRRIWTTFPGRKTQEEDPVRKITGGSKKNYGGPVRKITTSTDTTYQREEYASPQSGAGGSEGFGLSSQSRKHLLAKKMAKRFAQFVYARGRVRLKKGFDKEGRVTPPVFRAWVRTLEEMFEVVPPKEVKQTLLWWMEHEGQPGISECTTIPGFKEKFDNICAAMRRPSFRRNGEHTEDEVEKELVILPNGEGKLVPIR